MKTGDLFFFLFFSEDNVYMEVTYCAFFLSFFPYIVILFLCSCTIFYSVPLSPYFFFTLYSLSFPSHPLPFFLFHFSPLFPPFVSVSHNFPFLPSPINSFQLLYSNYFHFPFQFYDSFRSLSFSFLFFICILLHSYSSFLRVITSCLSQP